VLIDMILLHLASNLSSNEDGVGIICELPIGSAKFEYSGTSYGGILDYLVVNGPQDSIGQDQTHYFVCVLTLY